MPWSTLTYDTTLDGYRTNLTADNLKNAPKYTESTGRNWDGENDLMIREYYENFR